MEFLAAEEFSDNQKLIIQLRHEGKTYNQIIEILNRKTGNNTTPKNISTCLTRSALGFKWNYVESANAYPYLNQHDMKLLQELIINAAEMGSAFDTLEVLDESSKIKGQRIAY